MTYKINQKYTLLKNDNPIGNFKHYYIDCGELLKNEGTYNFELNYIVNNVDYNKQKYEYKISGNQFNVLEYFFQESIFLEGEIIDITNLSVDEINK